MVELSESYSEPRYNEKTGYWEQDVHWVGDDGKNYGGTGYTIVRSSKGLLPGELDKHVNFGPNVTAAYGASSGATWGSKVGSLLGAPGKVGGAVLGGIGGFLAGAFSPLSEAVNWVEKQVRVLTDSPPEEKPAPSIADYISAGWKVLGSYFNSSETAKAAPTNPATPGAVGAVGGIGATPPDATPPAPSGGIRIGDPGLPESGTDAYGSYTRTKNGLRDYGNDTYGVGTRSFTKTGRETAESRARNASKPIALDLDGNGVVELVDISASTAFYDLNGDGYRTHLGWVGPAAARSATIVPSVFEVRPPCPFPFDASPFRPVLILAQL